MAKRVPYLLRRGDGFWARMAVPGALRPIVGKTELLAPLGQNLRIAERDIHAVVAGFHQTLAEARAKLDVVALPKPKARPRPLTVAQIAHTHYAEELAVDERQRNHPDRADMLDMAWSRDGYVKLLRRVASGYPEDKDEDPALSVIGWAIEKFQKRGSTAVEPGSAEWRALARTLAQVQLEAVEAAIERDAGREPSPPKLPILAEPPMPSSVVPLRPRGPSVSLLDLFDGYLKVLQAQGKGAEAERRWRPVVKALVRWLGHDDARHISRADIDKWCDHLMESEKLSAKTVRDVHLGAVRAVLGWAAGKFKIPANPAAGIKIAVAKKVRTREKGLNDAEAAAVLKAALTYQPPSAHSPATRESEHITAAKRWLPWLCALTGARVAEMAQLRVQDIQTEKGITFFRITPDAGSVKSGEYRDVPVHPQLVSLGLLNFVRAAGDGALFFDASRVRKAGAQHPSKIVAARVGTWVRSLGVVDAAVDPSHGWRHRFKTVGREADIDYRVLDALQGHAGRTAGEDYGDVTLKTRDGAIRRIPAYDVR